MGLSNCTDCGILMVAKLSNPLCANCKIKHIQLSQKVKAFMSVHPGANRLDICRETGVPLRIIDQVVSAASR